MGVNHSDRQLNCKYLASEIFWRFFTVELGNKVEHSCSASKGFEIIMIFTELVYWFSNSGLKCKHCKNI